MIDVKFQHNVKNKKLVEPCKDLNVTYYMYKVVPIFKVISTALYYFRDQTSVGSKHIIPTPLARWIP